MNNIININQLTNWSQLEDYLRKIENINIPINMHYFNTYVIVYMVLFIIIGVLFIESIILKNKALSKIQKVVQDEEKGKIISNKKIKSIKRSIFYFYVISNLALFMGVALGLKAYFQFKGLKNQKAENMAEKCFRAKMLYNKVTGQCYIPKTIDYLKVYKEKLSKEYENMKYKYQAASNELYNTKLKIKEYKKYIQDYKYENDENIKQLVKMKEAALPALIKMKNILEKKVKYLKQKEEELAKKLNITNNYIAIYQDMKTVKNLNTEITENKKFNDFINSGLDFIKQQSIEDTIKFKAEMKAKNELEELKNR